MSIKIISDDSDTLYIGDNKVLLDTISGIDTADGIVSLDGNILIPLEKMIRKQEGKLTDQAGTSFEDGNIIGTYYEFDDTNRSYTDIATWNLGHTFTTYNKQAGSDIMISYRVPARNDNNSWGGSGLMIEYSLDNQETWVELLSSPYNGNCMVYNSAAILSQSGNLYLDKDEIRQANNITFRFKHKPHTTGNTLYINESHAIGGGVLGAFWTNITIMEIL